MMFEKLKQGDAIFLDANIFIYNFGARSAECRDLLLRCAKGELVGYTLTSVLTEVLYSGGTPGSGEIPERGRDQE